MDHPAIARGAVAPVIGPDHRGLRDMTKPPERLSLSVNGVRHAVEARRATPLLTILRNDLALNGPKYGCGLGECGACMVIIDGVAARSCAVPAGAVEGRDIVTLEGLGTQGTPHPVQQAFIAEQGAQCGYCLNGMIMTVKALLDRNPDPDEDEIREELRYNLCRCGTHVEILRAARRAAELVRAAGQAGR